MTELKNITDKAWHFVKAGKPDLALQLLYHPMQTIKKNKPNKDNAPLMGLYGYCACVCLKKRKEGIALCQKAKSLDSMDPRQYFLLGKAYQMAGTRKLAWQTFEEGLKIQPGYRPIMSAMERMGTRQKPVLGFLARENPLNIALGRMRSKNRH